MLILSCNYLGTCCNDYSIVPVLYSIKNIINLIQIIVPILLLIMVSVDLLKLVMNPEEKDGLKKITNKFIAAIIIFFIPTLINATMNLASTSFNVAACFKEADTIMNNSTNKKISYMDVNDNKKKTAIYNDPSKYEEGKPKKSTNKNKSSNTNNYSKDVESYMKAVKATVEYAKQHNYHYGDSHAIPPTTDGKISCDRLEAKALYDIGYTDQRQGGEVVSTLDSYLTSHGWSKSTNINDCKYGSIVLVKHAGTDGPPYHAFTVVSYNSSNNTMVTYDEGAEWRVHANQPFTSNYYNNSHIYGVYNMN